MDFTDLFRRNNLFNSQGRIVTQSLTICALNHLYTAHMWSPFVLKCAMPLCCF